MRVSRKTALFGLLAAGAAGCAGATSGSLLGARPSSGGRVPSDVFTVRKGRGAPKFSTRRVEAVTTGGGGSGGYDYTDGGTGYVAQANKSTGAANIYAPNGSFAAQFSVAAAGSGYALTVTHANGNQYICSMPDTNAIPNGTSSYNGATFNIDQTGGPSTASYGGWTATANYDPNTDAITTNLPDGSTALFPNVTGSAAPSAHGRETLQNRQAAGALLCVTRIIVSILITVITLLVIYATIKLCPILAATIIGIVVCAALVVVSIVLVVVTIYNWVVTYFTCTAPPPPPPPGAIAAQVPQPMQAQAGAT
ncbi:MAG: hypothetical protein JO103_14185 [Candidatus Eremiobacteraeota bacterium]|nr:hypothetical protein [Candidatus Eremiobacteraeota bacterium]MBV9407432.1 hypothetical protein [Candidatus Eremiobacteraeota bacterium]